MPELIADGIWFCANFLSAERCTALVRASEAAGFQSSKEVHERRDNERSALDDPLLSNEILERLQFAFATVPQPHVFKIAPEVRVYRYRPGHSVKTHVDAPTAIAEGLSTHTLLIYLSANCRGGATAFPDTGVAVRPIARAALMFDQRHPHTGTPVKSGVKHVLRATIALA
jgi:prolyl 4-hydroxylase